MRTMLIVYSLLFTVNVAACEKGCSEWQGVCACDIQPEQALAVKPDNARPPRSGVASWQAPGVTLFNAPELRAEDEKQDAEKAAADEQGKRSAGIKP